MIKRALQVEAVPMKFEHYCDFVRKWKDKATYLEYFDGAIRSRAIPEYPKDIDYEKPSITSRWESINTALCGIAGRLNFTQHEYLRIMVDDEKVLCPHLALITDIGDVYTFVEIAEPTSPYTSDMEGAIYRISEYIKCYPGSKGYAISITDEEGSKMVEVALVNEKDVCTVDVSVIVPKLSCVITYTEVKEWANMGAIQFYLRWLRSYSTEDEDYAAMEADLSKYKIITNTKLQRVSREIKACLNQKIDEEADSFSAIPNLFGAALCEVVEGIDKVVATKAYRATGGVARLVENNIIPLMLEKSKPLQKLCQRMAKMQLD